MDGKSKLPRHTALPQKTSALPPCQRTSPSAYLQQVICAPRACPQPTSRSSALPVRARSLVSTSGCNGKASLSAPGKARLSTMTMH